MNIKWIMVSEWKDKDLPLFCTNSLKELQVFLGLKDVKTVSVYLSRAKANNGIYLKYEFTILEEDV